MNRTFVILILFAIAGLSATAQQAVPPAAVKPVPGDPAEMALNSLRAGQIPAAEAQIKDITNPAARRFVQASIEQAKGEPKRAIQTVSDEIVQYPNDPDWTAKSELLSAALYMELGMIDAADVTARQIQMLHEGTDAAVKATALRNKIEQLKKVTEVKGSIK
ncbi:MAG: hypothetical protein PHP93_03555 [Kiritimatiellales bacterium]|nr:hypothetical protein [Kiritimatiellales bacterium]